jgi:hypothetical protein
MATAAGCIRNPATRCIVVGAEQTNQLICLEALQFLNSGIEVLVWTEPGDGVATDELGGEVLLS